MEPGSPAPPTGGLHYVVGDATRRQGDGAKIIAHVCNDAGAWGRGFVLAVSRRYPEAEAAYRAWHRERGGGPLPLGEVHFVHVGADVWVANLVGQRGLRRAGSRPPIRYEAIEQGLARVADRAAALRASVHMPRIGTGLAGGRWDEVEPLVERALVRRGLGVFVYDLGPA